MIKHYNNGDLINSHLHKHSSEDKDIFHIELLEALSSCTVSAGKRFIALDRSDIVISRHFKGLKLTSSKSKNILTHYEVDLEFPSPLNQFLVADNPLIHDLMNDQSAGLTYVTFHHLENQICHHYLQNIQIFDPQLDDPYIYFQNQRLWGLLFTELLRNHYQTINKPYSDFPSKEIRHASKDSQAGAIMSYITNKNGKVTLAETANYFGFQQHYFSRLCHQLFEFSFIHLRNQIRIDLACEMLRYTTKSIVEISDEIGYADQANFTKQFIKQKGMSPSKYRKVSN